MGVFSDFAPVYWESGYSIVPIEPKTKRTHVVYSNYREQQCSEETLKEWVEKYPDYNIAIVTGKASGLGVIDLDIKKNNSELLSKALSVFPRSPIERFGSKGLGIFIKYNGQQHRKLYYKKKEIGEIITNTIIVIPPSIHPDTNEPYKWTGYASLDSELKDDILGDLPCPTDAEITQAERSLEVSGVEVDKNYFKQLHGRNDKLKTICGSYISKGMLPEKIAPLLLTDDIILHGDKSLFSDQKEFKQLSKNPLACSYKFASSIFKTYLSQAVFKGEEIPQFSSERCEEIEEKKDFTKYEEFFKSHLRHCKKDAMDGQLKKKDWRGFWQPVGNDIDAIRSYGSDVGLKPERVKNHFKRYEGELKSELLFKKETWDGEDHIGEVMSHVKCKNMTVDESTHLVKYWLSKVKSRFESGEQNTMILFQGSQGTGKDLFIENLVGGFAPYFSNFTDANQEKDLFMQIAKNLVINISEFDKLNKKHPGMIKDLITRRTANFRPSHMPLFEDFRMNASFIGSTNAMDFLTDPTGNRRFWVFINTEIDWKYPKNKSGQILAQALSLADNGYQLDQEAVDKMTKSILSISPDSVDEAIIDLWNDGIDRIRKAGHSSSEEFDFNDVEEIMEKIKKFLGFRSIKKVQTQLKRLGAQHRSGQKRLYSRVKVTGNS